MPSPENPPSPPASPRRHAAFHRLLILAMLVLFILLLGIIFLTSSKPRLALLTQEQFIQAQKRGPFTRLKYKVINLTDPLLRHFRRHHPGILISSSLVERAADAPRPGQLGAPFTTNDTGMEAWILTPGEAASILPELKLKSYSSSLSTSRIQTSSGVPASLSMGSRIQLATGWVTLGNILDLTATTTAASVNLVFDAYSTDPDSTVTNQLVVKTNFYVACRALIPDSGGILINCGHTDPTNRISHWLLLTPQLLDDSGKPIRAP